jgi:hypothetical protein
VANCRLSARGAADPTVVWQRYAEPARWSEWSPQIRRVSVGADFNNQRTASADQRIVAGLIGWVHGPAGVRVRFVVDQVDDAARSWSWSVRLGPIPLRLQHIVETDANDGTLTSLAVSGPLPVVLSYLPFAQLALNRLVRR